MKEKLGITPESSFEGKIDQIGSFLSYRLTHIEKMCQGIMDKLQVKEWCKLENLKDLSTSSFRIHSYLSELLGKAFWFYIRPLVNNMQDKTKKNIIFLLLRFWE